MGSILSNQNYVQNQKSNHIEIGKMSHHWQVLQRTIEREILISKKTSLIVERYSFEMQNYEDFQSQNKLFQWRNHNPNSQFMVNVLSVGKDDSASQQSSFQCGSIEWCPSQKIKSKVYVVTERILKLWEINDVLKFQKQMENFTSNNRTKILYATDEVPKSPTIDKKSQKLQSFIGINFSQALGRQLLKDWIRSIQVLCYKFGYFMISENHLGMTVNKRGTSWISSNYSLNHLNPQDKIQVSTAQQKFKFERQTIQKITSLTETIPCFTNTIHTLKHKKIDRFDQFCAFLDQIAKTKKHSRQITSHQPQVKNMHNHSLFVEHGSFLTPNDILLHNNSSFFMFNHQNALQRVNSKNSNQKMASLQSSLHRKNSNLLVNSKNSRQILPNLTKRSNTGEKISTNLSPESILNFVNSNHKYCGKETAPTNQLGHSSSLQSVNHAANLKSNFEELQNKKYDSKNMFKSQNNTKVEPDQLNDKNLQKGVGSNNICFNHNVKHSFSSEPHIFRSHAANDLKSPKTSKNHQNWGFNSPNNRRSYYVHHNYSLDENNMIGPYRKDRVYSNLRREKIALVDSMVMVREQSQQIDEDMQNLSRGKYVLEESIIIMGRGEDHILSQIYQ